MYFTFVVRRLVKQLVADCAMASHQVVAVKGSLYRKKLLLLHLQGQGVSLVEPLTMKESWSWSFLEDSLCLAPSATDPDDIIITVSFKAAESLDASPTCVLHSHYSHLSV